VTWVKYLLNFFPQEEMWVSFKLVYSVSFCWLSLCPPRK